MSVPKWLVGEVDKVGRNNEKIAKSMLKIENWLREKDLIVDEEDGSICSLIDRHSLIERTDIESGIWKGSNFVKFIETGEIDDGKSNF